MLQLNKEALESKDTAYTSLYTALTALAEFELKELYGRNKQGVIKEEHIDEAVSVGVTILRATIETVEMCVKNEMKEYYTNK